MEDLDQLLDEVAGINSWITELDRLFYEEDELVYRRDRIARIKALRSCLECEIRRIQEDERQSEEIFHKTKVLSSAAGFAFGTLVGALMKNKDPLALGEKSFIRALDKTADFGKVLLAVSGNDQSFEVNAVSISSLTRKNGTTEQEVIMDLKGRGYFLLTDDRFWNVLDLLEKGITEGKYRSINEQNVALLEYARNESE